MKRDDTDYAVLVYLGQRVPRNRHTVKKLRDKLQGVTLLNGAKPDDIQLVKNRGPIGHHYAFCSLYRSEAEKLVGNINQENLYCAKAQYCR